MAEVTCKPENTCAVLDTDVFVAAGTNMGSASARLGGRGGAALAGVEPLDAGRDGDRAQAHPEAPVGGCVRAVPAPAEFQGEGDLAAVGFVEDPQDRKFAALALAADAALVSADDHLNAHRGRLDVWTPGEFLRTQVGTAENS